MGNFILSPIQQAWVNNCAVRQFYTDGGCIKRCSATLVDSVCPFHGDVSAVQAHYRVTGELTDEKAHLQNQQQGLKQRC